MPGSTNIGTLFGSGSGSLGDTVELSEMNVTGLCRIETGTYSGDGGASKVISLADATLTPMYLIVYQYSASESADRWRFSKSNQDHADICYVDDPADHDLLDDRLIGLAQGQFTVSDQSGDVDPNNNGRTYIYVVIGA